MTGGLPADEAAATSDEPSAARVGVLLLDGTSPVLDAVVGAIGRAPALGEVRAVERSTDVADLDPACRRLAEVCDLVVGLPAPPWPGFSTRHEQARARLGDVPYWAVESWHGLPALATRLADRVAAVAGVGDHVLLTAPDHAVVALPADQRAFLREVAQALDTALGDRAGRPTIAVDRSPADGAVTPTAADVVATLAEAHGATRLVRCSLAPGDGPDPAVGAAAAAQGLAAVDVALTDAEHVELLLDAVATLLQHGVATS